MSTLTKIIAPALAITLGLGAIAPANAATFEKARTEQAFKAQANGYAHGHRQDDRYGASRSALIRSNIENLRRDIDRAAARRMISEREAAGLRRDANSINRTYISYARNGLSPREQQTLQHRIDRVHGALHMERHDRDGHRR